MCPTVSLRPVTDTDRTVLAMATLGNLNWCAERFSMLQVLTRPEFSRYTVLVPARGDFGWTAEQAGEVVGLVWAQYFPRDNPGCGFLSEDIPEISIWVQEDRRGRGLGRMLLRHLQQDARTRRVPGLSLSVEAANEAKRLHLTESFTEVPGREADGVMAWTP